MLPCHHDAFFYHDALSSMTPSCLQDGKLTRQEVVDKYDVFVGSQVTDFGEVLNQHDEF